MATKKSSGGFAQMPKMMTNEPSAILKLKKGGHVASAHKDEHGHTNMKGDAFKAKYAMDKAEDGAAPKKPSMAERRKAMSGALLNSKKGGKVAKHEDAAQDRAMIKKALAGKKFAAGGTIKGNAGKFAKTKVVDGDKKDTAKGTGVVKMGKPAGYKTGGTIEGNAGKFVKTKVVGGDKTDKAHGTKGIKEGQPAGFKKGGKIGWENRPADDGDHFDPAHGTGGVREGNAGGYKKGGAAKKHFATGGSVNDAGRAVAMPRKPVSRPVANSLQSGTFKKGGKVKKYADGGNVSGGMGGTGGTTPMDYAISSNQSASVPGAPIGATFDGPAPMNPFGGMNPNIGKPGATIMPTMGTTSPVPADLQQQGQQAAMQKAAMQQAAMQQPPMSQQQLMQRAPMGGFGGMRPPMGGMRPPMGNMRPMPVAYNPNGATKLYKKGGKVKKFDIGGSTGNDIQDLSNGAYAGTYKNQRDENERDREAILGAPGRAYDAVKRLLGGKPGAGAGRGMVNPPMAKKRGGGAKC